MQQSFSSGGGKPFLNIAEAAKEFGVSEATVRNWLKTGYLDFSGKNAVCPRSLEKFRADIAGREKLISRANKSLLDRHDHRRLSDCVRSLIRHDDGKDPGAVYESSLSASYRNREGIYYTPQKICKTMLDGLDVDYSAMTFCDPCCGSGNFIISAIEKGVKAENIYGYDVDQNAVAIARRRVCRMTGGITPRNIKCLDFLAFAADSRPPFRQFDMIATNPPWGKKLSKDRRLELAAGFGAGKSLDTSALFCLACLKFLEKEGFLSFLVPESFFKIHSFYDARKHVLARRILSLRDFGRVFNGLLTKAYGFCLQGKPPAHENDVACFQGGSCFPRKQRSFLQKPSLILNINSSQDDETIISQICSLPYITLENNAAWGMGIVTGNNRKFCRNEPQEGYIPVYKGADISKGADSRPSVFIPGDLSQYQQVAPAALFQAEEKLLYRFISTGLVFYYDNRKSYCLNSLNFLIPHADFPVSIKMLCRFLNMEIVTWLHRKIFDTPKILRSDLEKLPVPYVFLQQEGAFSEEQLLHYYGIEKFHNGGYRLKRGAGAGLYP